MDGGVVGKRDDIRVPDRVRPLKVCLHPPSAPDEEVVVRVVVGGAVVVVDGAQRIAIREYVIVCNLIVGLGGRARQARDGVVEEIWIAVPTVKRTVIARFAAAPEDDVREDARAAAEPVVKIDVGARAVVENVSFNEVLARLELRVA